LSFCDIFVHHSSCIHRSQRFDSTASELIQYVIRHSAWRIPSFTAGLINEIPLDIFENSAIHKAAAI
jgi:hypothetical protein